ncbi:MAG: hypothetical protein LBN22_03580 [Clostridiales Family XIII bacterium]|jgi:NTP pyrophosphatase (non-canonical NTP hydrolase)|nr:hypothetical protein [Clostridiales Family XIII bacterium]
MTTGKLNHSRKMDYGAHNCNRDKVEYIADHYGLKSQLNKLHEELVELAEVVNTQPSMILTERLVDEMADVTIMLDQIEYLMTMKKAKFKKLLGDRIAFKLDRQISRVRCEE